MHYDSYGNGAFARPAMVKLDGSIIEPNTKMSDLDIATLNKMYPCENSCDHTNVQGKTNVFPGPKSEIFVRLQIINFVAKSDLLKHY